MPYFPRFVNEERWELNFLRTARDHLSEVGRMVEVDTDALCAALKDCSPTFHRLVALHTQVFKPGFQRQPSLKNVPELVDTGFLCGGFQNFGS